MLCCFQKLKTQQNPWNKSSSLVFLLTNIILSRTCSSGVSTNKLCYTHVPQTLLCFQCSQRTNSSYCPSIGVVFRWHNSFTYESFKHMHIILQPQNIYDMHECQRAGEKNNFIEKVICKLVTDVISLSEILAGYYQAVSPTVSTLHFASLFPVMPVHIFILKAFLSMLPAWNNVIAVVQRLRQTEQAVLGSNGAAYYQVFFVFFKCRGGKLGVILASP